ncbi:thiamine phosphate synthase [Metabacillus schmidteae]|uniref:thiamine phosphate synthase n=1 Tax=Metabacillus schmidteae TaxID=2730405 RepID=UPI00158BFC7F|nr:thiamine phosphate synthase [Metabacillus schmidteae]
MEFHVITDGKQTIAELIKRLSIIHNEVDYIHIREKTKSASDIMLLVSELVAKGVQKEKLVINDRMDVAILQNIPNLHLPSHSFSIQEVKKYRPAFRIGRSIHSLEEAIQCEKEGADYLLYGHIFETTCKVDLLPRGVEQLKIICENVKVPVIAIGGITPVTIDQLKGTNVYGVAVMSYIMQNKDPKQALIKLKEKSNRGEIQ